ncbi:MAG: PDZ domain-containing protein [Prevotella sp.]|mgnify:CR=1 FL=1|nr:PDZ domain-containing protein [Prevotella sp.]
MNRKYIYIIMVAMLTAFATEMAGEEKNHNFAVARNLETFSAIYKNLDMMYVDTLDADVTVGQGITAMLRSLDPYTEYYAASDMKDLKQMLTGKYAGIGALIKKDLRTGRVVIDELYEGMPAERAGLRKGDQIVAIDDSSMVGKEVAQVSSKLRGEPGTTFLLKVERPMLTGTKTGTGTLAGTKAKTKTLKLKITRGAIQLPSVPYYGMMGDGVGYIVLSQFTEDCSRDFRRALVDMRGKGMKKLVFDLRGNGGGSLQEAIKIVNMFVGKGTTLVTTKGKLKRSNNVYRTEQEPLDTVMPVVVLVNESTASASEITAGSLQDLDRAVVMGTRTYGKGLVQQTVDLPHNGSLKLTVSKYYIPSGRCIQAINYKHTGGGYREHIPDSLTKEFTTRGGRKVRDGGGIKPDIEVKPDTMTNIAMYLFRGALDSTEVVHYYVTDYVNSHEKIAPAGEFHLTDAEFDDFKQRVIESGFKYDRETSKEYKKLVEFAKFEGYYDDAKAEFEALEKKLQHNLERELEGSREMIRQMLEQEIVTAYYYQKGRIAYMVDTDSQVKRAKELLMDEEAYIGELRVKN